MSSFTFPPPPPPAPIPATSSTYSPYGNSNQHGSNISRGRGTYRGQPTRSRGNGQNWADHRRTFNTRYHNTAMTQQAMSSDTASISNQQAPYGPGMASGQSAPVTEAQAHTNAYNWLYQSMHMYSQASTFASPFQGHSTETVSVPPTHTSLSRVSNSGNFKQSHQNSYHDVRGTKRKRGDFQPSHRGGQQHRQPPAHSRIGNATQVAPAVPSFGFSLPASVQETATLTEEKSSQPSTKKQKHNLLGLTPQLAEDEDDEGEEDGGMDEEASGMSTGVGLQIEHKGQVATLKTEKDIAAWIAERKKRYPTKARIDQKNAEALKKKQAVEEARERALKTTKSQDSTAEKKKRDVNGKVKANKHLNKAEKLREKLKAAEAKVARAMTKDDSNNIKKQRCGDVKPSLPERPCTRESIEGTQDKKSSHPVHQQIANKPNLGLDYSSTSSSASASASSSRGNSPLSSSDPDLDLSDSSTSVSISASSLSSSPPLPASSSDTAHPAPSSGHAGKPIPDDPENTPTATKETTKHDPKAIPQHQTTSTHSSKKRPCKFFLKSGRCRNGERCKFSHDIKTRQKKQQDQDQKQNQNGRHPHQRTNASKTDSGIYITLSERLQMQEQREREQFLLQVIKDLGQRGVLDPGPS